MISEALLTELKNRLGQIKGECPHRLSVSYLTQDAGSIRAAFDDILERQNQLIVVLEHTLDVLDNVVESTAYDQRHYPTAMNA